MLLTGSKPGCAINRCLIGTPRPLFDPFSRERGERWKTSTIRHSAIRQTKTETQADKEWTEFERDLDTLGHQLAALQAHTAALGSQLVSTLEARFQR